MNPSLSVNMVKVNEEKQMYVENTINSCKESGWIFQVRSMFLLGIQAETVPVCYVV